MAERVTMNLRLTTDLHEALKRIAEEQHRSLHGLIIHALHQIATEREVSRPSAN